MGGQCQYAHLGLWLPYFNFVKYPKFGSVTLAAIQNAKVIQSSIQSANALKATYTSISAQGRTPKDVRSSVGFFQLLELFLLFAKIPCLTSEQMKRRWWWWWWQWTITECTALSALYTITYLIQQPYEAGTTIMPILNNRETVKTKEQSGEVACPKSQRR